MDAVSRRLKLLKLEGLGFSQAEIVKELSSELGCSSRTVYGDFESRSEWQPSLQSGGDHERVLLKIANRYEQIYRQASVRLLTGSNELAQLGALNVMLKANAMRVSLCNTRKKLTRKLGNPRLEQIHFHTIRHWKATTLYHQTKDILYVKQFMGHRRIESTLVYVQIESALFVNTSQDFTCKVAETKDEIKQLVEAGFEYVLQQGNLAYFRKRK